LKKFFLNNYYNKLNYWVNKDLKLPNLKKKWLNYNKNKINKHYINKHQNNWK